MDKKISTPTYNTNILHLHYTYNTPVQTMITTVLGTGLAIVAAFTLFKIFSSKKRDVTVSVFLMKDCKYCEMAKPTIEVIDKHIPLQKYTYEPSRPNSYVNELMDQYEVDRVPVFIAEIIDDSGNHNYEKYYIRDYHSPEKEVENFGKWLKEYLLKASGQHN